MYFCFRFYVIGKPMVNPFSGSSFPDLSMAMKRLLLWRSIQLFGLSEAKYPFPICRSSHTIFRARVKLDFLKRHVLAYANGTYGCFYLHLRFFLLQQESQCLIRSFLQLDLQLRWPGWKAWRPDQDACQAAGSQGELQLGWWRLLWWRELQRSRENRSVACCLK